MSRDDDNRVRELAAMLRVPPEDVVERVKRIIAECDQMRAKLEAGGDFSVISAVGGVAMFTRSVSGVRPKHLRALVDAGKRQIGSGIVAVVNVADDGKANLAVGITSDLVGKFSAVDLAKVGGIALGGQGGGGRPDLAVSGGPHGSKAADALSAIEAAINEGNGA